MSPGARARRRERRVAEGRVPTHAQRVRVVGAFFLLGAIGLFGLGFAAVYVVGAIARLVGGTH